MTHTVHTHVAHNEFPLVKQSMTTSNPEFTVIMYYQYGKPL